MTKRDAISIHFESDNGSAAPLYHKMPNELHIQSAHLVFDP